MGQERFESVLDVLRDREDVVVTFDDGFRSDASTALPSLRSRGMVARFFITVAHLGQPGYLRPEDVKTLADNGMTVGTHGWRHISWRRLDRDQLVSEITRSRAVLEDLIGAEVKELSIPSGQYNRRVLNVIRDLGFDRTYTVDGPWARLDRWLQPRFAVTNADTPETVQATLALSRRGFGVAVRAGKRWIKQNRWW
jgi:peptidoglycan/xylan/chitin deacetylase (PgdA/CDA1 family)